MEELFSPKKGKKIATPKQEARDIVTLLTSYKDEAVEARRNGLNPRDAKWTENLDLYWNRFDFSTKADWQAKEVTPEVPSFVDRFAAALKEALVATPDGFYTIIDPADAEGDLTSSLKKVNDQWLSTCGRTANGLPLSFPAVFEEQVKMGALMACASVTTWKNDRLSIETVDPRFIWLDHTNRNLYRIRRIEIDAHQLKAMIKQKDGKGKSIFNMEEMDLATASMVKGSAILENSQDREDLTGHTSQVQSSRQQIVLDEYLATIIDNNGDVIAEDALCVVANDEFLIRGPEENPFWHKKDWVTYAPLVTTPLSVYGRTYMEDFGSVAKTFNKLTNLILDAVYTSSLNAFAIAPGMLINPEQIAEGVSPNKIFLLEDGVRPQDFHSALDMGQLSSDTIRVWENIKQELREAADINEVGLGQFAPKGRTSATEITSTQQSSNALIRSIAHTVETHWLDQTLDIGWKTGIQHVRKDDKTMMRVVGPEMWSALMTNRKELASKDLTFQARGISTLIQKAQLLQSLIQVMQIMSSNEILLREFLQQVEVSKLVDLILELSGIDKSKLRTTEREQLVKSVTQPIEQRQAQVEAENQGRVAGDKTRQDAGQIAGSLGLG